MDAPQSELGRGGLEHASSDEIRDEIRGTRREMNDTLDELGDRLHPRHLLDDVIDLFRGSDVGSQSREQIVRASQKVGRGIAEQVKVHPIPALLAGIALARWVYESATEHESESESTFSAEPGSYPPSEWETGPAVGEKAQGIVSGAAHKAQDALSGVARKATSAAGAVGERLREQGRALGHYSAAGGHRIGQGSQAVQQRFRQASQEYPIPVGAGFLVAGLLAGLLIPRTVPEHESLGDAADRLKDKTRAKGEEMLEKGNSMAASAAASAMDEAAARGLSPT